MSKLVFFPEVDTLKQILDHLPMFLFCFFAAVGTILSVVDLDLEASSAIATQAHKYYALGMLHALNFSHIFFHGNWFWSLELKIILYRIRVCNE